jgi:DNA helicase-2/ATP-dependent DNA helicase PcrA
MLSRNKENDSSGLWSNIAPDVKVHIHKSATDRSEAEFVVHRIEQFVGGTSYFSIDSKRVDSDGLPKDYTFSDFAVLVRTKQLAKPLVEALNRSGIPFNSLSDETITSEDLYQFLTTSLRMVIRPNNNIDHTIDKELAERLDVVKRSIIHSDLAALNASQLINHIWEISSIDNWLVDSNSQEIRKRLVRFAQPFDHSIDAFLDALMLQKKVDNFDRHHERVNILTLHASKGLEFPVVFIVGCEEGILPLVHGTEQADLNEERRLLYVGMTRAQRYLFLSYSRKRFWNGDYSVRKQSRFLRPISESLIQLEHMMPRKTKRTDNQLKLF